MVHVMKTIIESSASCIILNTVVKYRVLPICIVDRGRDKQSTALEYVTHSVLN